MSLVYTRRLTEGELFEGFQRRLLGEFDLAAETGHEVDRFTDRHGNAKIQCDSAVLTCAAGYFFEAIGNIRLGALVKLHVSVAVSYTHLTLPTSDLV